MSFDILLSQDVWLLFGSGLRVTLELFAVSAVSALVLGSTLAMVRLTFVWGAPLVVGFVEYHRNVPSIVQLLVWYFGVPQLLPEAGRMWANEHLADFSFAAIALSLNAAAYISEDLRSGFRAVPHGQYEATRALAMTHLQSLRHVLLPQAIRACLPALVNQMLSLFKATTLAMAIGVGDLMYVARQIDGQTYATFAAFLVPSLIYLSCSLMLMFGGERLQRRFSPTAGG